MQGVSDTLHTTLAVQAELSWSDKICMSTAIYSFSTAKQLVEGSPYVSVYVSSHVGLLK